jgi:peroxiredoxin
MVEKLHWPVSLLSDPEGEMARFYGVWDEQGQIARPALFVLDGEGVVRYAYVGEDFADRPGDGPVFEALRRAAG